ncbi:MAG: FxsA family protein [Boseongicola sp.]|nr:FxsA family protein [Boseongicola sp.]
MRLFLLFLMVPLCEIALFIQIGGAIGLGLTLVVVILTAVLGATLVRSQGLLVLTELRGSLHDLKDPTEPLAHGAMILFSGALLLTPGFLTDSIGLALMVPAVRRSAFRLLRDRIVVQGFAYDSSVRPPEADVVDGEFEELSDGPSDGHGIERHRTF